MENWKKQEIARFYSAFRAVEEEARGPYVELCNKAAQLLFPSKQYSESSFEHKRLLLQQGSQTISISELEDGDVLRELAIAWAEVNLHADTSENDWFEASVDYIFRLAKYGQSRSGLDAFLWHRELGVHLCIWSHGMFERLHAGTGAQVDRLLLERTDHSTHPTLAGLHYIQNILCGLDQYCVSGKARKRLIASGGDFFGRLQFTHAFCTGIGVLEGAGGIRPYLSVVNGAIAAWPYPLVKDQEFTFALIEKMGSPHYVPQAEPGYFESEAWCERLLAASRDYLESFQRLFCEGDARDPSNADSWRQLGAALQVFSEIVLVYDIDNYRKP